MSAPLAVGDLLFFHRHGPIRALIHLGQWLRPSLRPWAHLTHVACVAAPGVLIEAEWPRVHATPLDAYQSSEYVVARTGMDAHDQPQAAAYLNACVGERYGWLTFLGTALRMLTPGAGGLFFGGNRTAICSGMAACMLERGSFIAAGNASTMCPAALARAVGVPARS